MGQIRVGFSRMAGSSRQKGKHERRKENSPEDANEGTAARTRPLSFEVIMLKRKSKKEQEDFKGEDEKLDNIVEKGTINHGNSKVVHDRSNSHRMNTNRDDKNTRDDSQKANYRKKEEKASRKGDDHGKIKESHKSEGRLRSKLEYVSSKSEEVKGDNRIQGRSKMSERLRDNKEYDNEKKHLRGSLASNRYTDRSTGTYERENKRKNRNGEDEKYRDRYAVKKHDSGKGYDAEILERKEKTIRSRIEETRSKRRRSRSEERVKSRGRRSGSSSPKAHKHVPSHGHEQGERFSHSHEDRHSRHNSDIDKIRISGNGLSSHHHRHGGPSSGLGGYSPRKRRSEAAGRTPLPPKRSPEKKGAAWDLPPVATDTNVAGSNLSTPPLFVQTKTTNVVESAGALPVAANVVKHFAGILSNNLSVIRQASLDSIQLTQATRPMRRLYIDNIPETATEKDIIEFFNNFLLSSGSSHIKGTQPCISCMIHKEKGQALLEFLTPEDASAALLLDGRSLEGKILKIRRPKEFNDVTGSLEKSKAGAGAIVGVVKDSPHKIFIGGISKSLSSEMLLEIVSAFGPVNAYRFEVCEDLNEPIAFLEYADQSTTLKACASLNGMKVGGKVLAVAQATPKASPVENAGSRPFYGVPDHVKPLLEMPTEVLKLKNVLNEDDLKLLSESNLEEILEDVRVECARFGSVSAVNVVKPSNVAVSHNATDDVGSSGVPRVGEHDNEHNIQKEYLKDGERMESGSSVEELKANDRSIEGERTDGDIQHETGPNTAASNTGGVLVDIEEPNHADNIQQSIRNHEIDGNSKEISDHKNCIEVQLDTHDHKLASDDDNHINSGADKSLIPEHMSEKLPEAVPVQRNGSKGELQTTEDQKDEIICDLDNVFEAGCILVEFKRSEASCMAAHCLHGRLFSDRVLAVEYVPLELYRAKFPK